MDSKLDANGWETSSVDIYSTGGYIGEEGLRAAGKNCELVINYAGAAIENNDVTTKLFWPATENSGETFATPDWVESNFYTKNEINNNREISIFKDGVVL